MLTENLSYLRKKHKLSQQALADKLDVPRTTLSGWERGSAEPNIEMLVRIADTFEIKVDALLRKRIEHEDLEILRQKDLRVLAISVDKDNRQQIDLVDSKAEAGYLESFRDPEYIKELPKIHMPAIPEGNTYRAFEIQGDSMLPLEPGSIVIASFVEQLSELKDGSTYIIATRDNGLVYKRVRLNPQENSVMAVSDNVLFPPYEIPFGDIDEIWKYYAHIGFDDLKRSFDSYFNEKIDDIQSKVTEIHRRVVDSE